MEHDIDIFSLDTIQKMTEDAQVLREILREEEAKHIIKWIIFEIKQRANQGYEYFSYILHGKKCDYAPQIEKYFRNKGFSVDCNSNPTYLIDKVACITIDWSKKSTSQEKSFFKRLFNLEK